MLDSPQQGSNDRSDRGGFGGGQGQSGFGGGFGSNVDDDFVPGFDS
jgi:hypothetical protein